MNRLGNEVQTSFSKRVVNSCLVYYSFFGIVRGDKNKENALFP